MQKCTRRGAGFGCSDSYGAACRRDAMESGSFSQVPPAASASGHKAADWKVRMTPKKI